MAAPMVIRRGSKQIIEHTLLQQSILRFSCGLKHGRAFTTQTETTEDRQELSKIVIAPYKERTKVSVLQAIASTVKKDYSAPHYKYIDDPFLIPTSGIEKRVFSLSKSSGIKAAKYVAENYPRYFDVYQSVPEVPSFVDHYSTRHAEDTVEGLKERIQLRLPTQSFASYQKLRESGIEIPTRQQNDLLALLCFYNSSDLDEILTPDEQFFKRDMNRESQRLIKSWKDAGLAEQVFENMENPDAEAYSSLVKGRAKYYQVEKAYDLFCQMKEKNLKVDVSTFNAILKIASFIRDRTEERWQLIKDIMADMKESGVMPNTQTFNDIFFALYRCRKYRQTTNFSMQLLSEMKQCGLEPSLATWFYVLQIFYSSDDCQSNVLYDIVTELEGKNLTASHPDDYEFFVTAMAKCHQNIKDMELAYRIDAVLNHGDNINLLGDGYQEGMYYTNFLRLICMFEQIDTIMEQYQRITPHAYTPTFFALGDLLRAIELNEGYTYLPQIWSDLILFDYAKKTDFVEKVLFMMAKERQETSLQEMFVNVVDNIKQRAQEDAENQRLIRKLELTGGMIGNMMQIHLNNDDTQKAWEVFEVYYNNRRKIENFPSEISLCNMAEKFLEQKDLEKLNTVLTVVSDCAYPKLDSLIERTKETFTLSEAEIKHLDDLL